jgi:hypothetical protein
MATRHLAALAIAAAFIPTPAGASDIANYEGPGMKFYYRIPLDAGRGKDSTPAFGLQMRGERAHEVVNFDNHLVNNFLAGGIAAKWIVVGVVAAGATVAVAAKDKSTSQSYQQQKQQQQQQIENCTTAC